MASDSHVTVPGAVLGSQRIREYLDAGHIFRHGTWDKDCIQEASYDLRVARDFLVVRGEAYPEGQAYDQEFISIASGEVAILSTVEQLCMPDDLVGRIGIKFRFTRQGLTPLFGAQVDPGYGADHPDERLYLFVCNLSQEAVQFRPAEKVFNIEFHRVDGEIRRSPREFVRPAIARLFFAHPRRQLGFVRAINERLDCIAGELRRLDTLQTTIDGIEKGLTQVVLFGVLLVAAALFGGAATTLLVALLSPGVALLLPDLAGAVPWAVWVFFVLSLITIIGLFVLFGRAIWKLSK